MTLVLSYLTEQSVVQVSDRRLVRPSGGTVIVADDEANKAVNYCHRMALGYTGLAEIAGIRTDLWVKDVLLELPQQSIQDAVEAVRQRATESFARMRHIAAKDRRHAFVGVGWAVPAGEQAFEAFAVLISNFHDGFENQLPAARDIFAVDFAFRPSRPVGCLVLTGRRPCADTEAYLRRNLRKCARKRRGPLAAIGLLADAIRKTASVYRSVGSNLMALSIPKSTLALDSPFYLAGTPSNDAHTFLYLPSDRSAPTVYGPNFVCGGSALTGFRVDTGESARRIAATLDSRTPLEFYKAVVLTELTGSGRFGDSRRPLVAEEYPIPSHGAMSDVPSWPRDQACPFYGYLLGVVCEASVVEDISRDARFVVVMREHHRTGLPDPAWLENLRRWFAARGMPPEEASHLVARLRGLTRVELSEELGRLLKLSRQPSDEP